MIYPYPKRPCDAYIIFSICFVFISCGARSIFSLLYCTSAITFDARLSSHPRYQCYCRIYVSSVTPLWTNFTAQSFVLCSETRSLLWKMRISALFTVRVLQRKNWQLCVERFHKLSKRHRTCELWYISRKNEHDRLEKRKSVTGELKRNQIKLVSWPNGKYSSGRLSQQHFKTKFRKQWKKIRAPFSSSTVLSTQTSRGTVVTACYETNIIRQERERYNLGQAGQQNYNHTLQSLFLSCRLDGWTVLSKVYSVS